MLPTLRWKPAELRRGFVCLAAFALTLQSAVVAGVTTLSSPGRRFDNLTGFRLTSFWFLVVFLIVGLLSALLVTLPRLRAQELKAEKSDNWIYLGHLRHWEGKDLQDALLNSDPLPVVCRQLVHMSKIAWVKHRRVQLSSPRPRSQACASY